jgi:hypothetical protein
MVMVGVRDVNRSSGWVKIWMRDAGIDKTIVDWLGGINVDIGCPRAFRGRRRAYANCWSAYICQLDQLSGPERSINSPIQTLTNI